MTPTARRDVATAPTTRTVERSAELAVEIAERLLPVDAVIAGRPARDHGSMAGLSATALLHARFAATDTRFAAAARAHWVQAVARTRQHNARSRATGTFVGLGAVAASLILGSAYLPEPEPLRAATADATGWLSACARSLAEQHRADLDSGATNTPWSVYDAIAGLSGIGRVLLAAAQVGHTHAHDGLDASLTTLTSMINKLGPRGRPGWWLPSDQHPSGAAIPASGAATTGLAHGIAGPVALLSTALSKGYGVVGQADAIRRATRWLIRWQTPEPARDWPPYLTGADLDLGVASVTGGRRTAWCYGTPGISRALALAAHALADTALHTASVTATTALAVSSPSTWDVEGPTICHGYAGILQAVDHPAVAEQAAAAIIAAFDGRHRFGLQHRERGVAFHSPGLLTGAAGVGLVLADHGRLPAPDHATDWDSIVLLS